MLFFQILFLSYSTKTEILGEKFVKVNTCSIVGMVGSENAFCIPNKDFILSDGDAQRKPHVMPRW